MCYPTLCPPDSGTRRLLTVDPIMLEYTSCQGARFARSRSIKIGIGWTKTVPTGPEDYDLELDRVIARIKDLRASRVCFQMADGLKTYIPAIRQRVETETDAVPIFSVDPCFGACDLSRSMPEIGCELIVHLGHSKMLEFGSVPVIYVPCFSNTGIEDVLLERVDDITEPSLGLLSSIQHIRELPAVAEILEKRGHEVNIGSPGSRTQHPGQILGCNFHAAEDVMEDVDAFVYIGGGDFHPLGVALKTGKKVYALDPYRRELRDLSGLADRTLRKRFAQIDRARDAKRFGLLVSAKPGQLRLHEAERYRKDLMDRGREAVILCSDHLDPERLVIVDVDAFVNFGCPRIAVEDVALFPKPVLTPIELDILLGERDWGDYSLDEIA